MMVDCKRWIGKGWWFWKRVKAIRQTISSNNPYVEIRYSEYIKIDKK